MPKRETKFYEFGPYRLYPVERILLRDEEVIRLSPKQFDVLSYLLENPDRSIAKEELLSEVWKDSFVSEASLAQTIAYIRRALGPHSIQTVKGEGYRFVENVKEDKEKVDPGFAPLRRLKVFLCHASGDKPTVRELYRRLQTDGFAPWLDEEDLLPGQEWEKEIPKAVRASDAIIVCLSKGSITKTGYVQKEIKFALEVAQEQPEDTIFIIPLRLEECDVPAQLRGWQWADYFEDTGYQRLVKALRYRARTLGIGE